MLITSPVSWELANKECERNGGKLMEPDLDYLDTYRESISEWMEANKISDIWVRKYFTPWVFLKGKLNCITIQISIISEALITM